MIEFKCIFCTNILKPNHNDDFTFVCIHDEYKVRYKLYQNGVDIFIANNLNQDLILFIETFTSPFSSSHIYYYNNNSCFEINFFYFENLTIESLVFKINKLKAFI